jgi:predicted Zn finger-like uncharacterized protein
MRLTCPSCATRYEVADGLIAARGQHVQCTSCHTRWFERPSARTSGAEFGEDAIIARLEARGGRGSRPLPSPVEAARKAGGEFLWEGPAAGADEPRRPGPRLRLVTEAAQADDEVDQDEEALGDAVQDAEMRDEEASTRGAQVSAPPSAGERGAVKGEGSESVALRHAAPEAGRLPAPETGRSPAPGAGAARQRLDLDGLTPRREEHPASAAPARRRGGFGLAVALAVLALLVIAYFSAEQIAAVVPALEALLEGYVAAVEDGAAALGFRDAAE